MLTSNTVIIVPTYNEAENLPRLLDRLGEAVPGAHVLIVDDASPDGTADLAESIRTRSLIISVLRRDPPRGLGLSYVDGYREALLRGYRYIVQMDADLSHAPEYVPALLAAATSADVVIGSRYCKGGGVENWPVHRRALSRFANRYVAAIAGLKTTDSTSGFRCYTRHGLEQIAVETVVSNGYAFQVEMTWRAEDSGLTMAEVPIVFTDRTQGSSKISKAVILESIIMPFRLRLRRGQPLRCAAPKNPHKGSTL